MFAFDQEIKDSKDFLTFFREDPAVLSHALISQSRWDSFKLVWKWRGAQNSAAPVVTPLARCFQASHWQIVIFCLEVSTDFSAVHPEAAPVWAADGIQHLSEDPVTFWNHSAFSTGMSSWIALCGILENLFVQTSVKGGFVRVWKAVILPYLQPVQENLWSNCWRS